VRNFSLAQNPITSLAYEAGVPLVKTYFSSTGTYDPNGASSSGADAQGDALMSSLRSNFNAYRTALGPAAALPMSATQVIDYSEWGARAGALLYADSPALHAGPSTRPTPLTPLSPPHTVAHPLRLA
jgi:hypothetical protein